MRGGIKGAITQAFGDEHDCVLQTTIRSSHNIFPGHSAGMQLGAGRICVHVYARRSGPLARKLHQSFYCRGSGKGTIIGRGATRSRFARFHEQNKSGSEQYHYSFSFHRACISLVQIFCSSTF